MKKKLYYLYCILILTAVLAGVGSVSPKVFDIGRYYFSESNRDPLALKGMLEGISVLLSIPVVAISLLKPCRSNGSKKMRIIFGIVGVILLGLWITTALMEKSNDMILAQRSIIGSMVNNDGALFLVIGVLDNLVFAFKGNGVLISAKNIFMCFKTKA